MASAFSLSGLAAYVAKNPDVYLSSLITGAQTIEIIKSEGHVQTGIKTTEKINFLDTEATWQEGDGCGFNPLGTDTFTQRTITVGNIKINKEWCMDDLLPYFTQEKMKRGAMAEHEDNPLEAAILDRMLAKQQRDMEKAVWQGDTASGDDKLQHFDGFLKLIDTSGGAIWTNLATPAGTVTVAAAGTAVVGVGTAFTTAAPVGTKIYNTSGVYMGQVSAVADDTHLTLAAPGSVVAVTAGAYKTLVAANYATSTTSNINTRIDLIYAGISEAVLNSDSARLWIGADEARTYQRYLTAANLFNYTADANFIKDGFILPGTSLKIQPTSGLSGTGRKVAMSPDNMYFGTDLENEWEQFKVWYNEEDEMLRMKARWRAGVQIAFPAEVTASY